MRTWLLILSAGAALLVSLAVGVAFFEPTGAVRGYFRGEAFHRDKPTSYWKKVLKEDAASGDIRRQTLMQFVGSPGTATTVLREALADPDPDLRWTAAAHLGQLGPNAARVIPDLTRALADPEVRVRFHAAEALGKMNRLARQALPEIVEMMRDPDERVAFMAAHAYWSIDFEAAKKEFGWTEFRSEPWRFRAVMPPGVAENVHDVADLPAEVASHVHSFSTTQNGAAYTISVSEPLVLGKDGELEGHDRLAALKTTHLALPGLRLLRDRGTTLGGLKGFEFFYQGENNARIFMRLGLCRDGKRVYKALVAGHWEDLQAPQTEHFFESFQFLEPTPQSKPQGD